MKNFRLLTLPLGGLLALMSMQAESAVIESSNVSIAGNAYETFVDNTTGRVWLDIDSFWGAPNTYNSISTLLSGSGFRLATLMELQTLQLSMPADPATWDYDAQVVGGNIASRNIIWGIFEDGDAGNVSYSWRQAGDTNWQTRFNNNGLGANSVLNADLGAWVVEDVAVVPVPAAVWLFGSALIGLIGVARRKKA